MSLSKLMPLLQKYPVIPSMVTFGLLFPGANIIQQTCFKKHNPGSNEVDWGEVTRFSIYGGLLHGPLVYNWVNLISRLLPKTTVPHVILKVMVDQVCFAPVTLSSFLIVLNTMEGKNLEEVTQQWKDKFIPTYATGACVWPVLKAVNYKIVPLKFRSIYIAICNFFWIIFLAHQRSRKVPWKSPLLRILI